MPRFSANQLRAIGYALFEGIGCSAEHARMVTDHLVESNLFGHDSHGVIRYHEYITRIHSGQFGMGTEPSIVRDNPCAAVVDGGSKTFSMTGFRIGFLAAPEPIASAVARLNSQLNGCPSAIAQVAYQAALEEEPPELREMVEAFAGRRKLLVDGLTSMGLETPWPGGAFYAFPNVRPFFDETRGTDSEAFCRTLLEDQAVAIVPGKFFGMDDHVRLSYATSMKNVRGALERLGRFLASKG